MRVQVSGFPAGDSDDDPLGLVVRSGDRLAGAAAALSDAQVRAPSGLPGWTRGHVLAHVAHSADAYVWMLGLARTGRAPGPRADKATLAAALQRDASLSAGRLTALLRESLDRFTAQALAMPAPAWGTPVAALAGWRHPAWYLLLRCLRELETHHFDLAVGHGTEKWPEAYVCWALDDTLGTLRTQGFPLASVEAVDLGRHWPLAQAGPSVAGAGHLVLGWLSGRLPADALNTYGPARPLPTPPAWPQPPLPGWGRIDSET
ncbi:maleylpyruvate isomerase family mycothiol-dependent enzyme [Streptomyces broussonetiae]|uniref:Maleylpyruvate isomerase family mycothiol-dependent enzyme n=1 Tax=Streptomyces broussonetiae TaxID=2686304 RepID=A0A6I6MRA1_9ACTN|nr:maleylpyruvate isomerase family mycothiol-dependent enzyme [Streptomyces broussonetiae]QHA03058.1 maleylpyruvate isomerase family mycothiol-dependent enzyme [Streptomyces broussonetiae]